MDTTGFIHRFEKGRLAGYFEKSSDISVVAHCGQERRVSRADPKLLMLSMASSSASRICPRWTRLLMVPAAQPRMAAASS
jgi:hypothetical protein